MDSTNQRIEHSFTTPTSPTTTPLIISSLTTQETTSFQTTTSTHLVPAQLPPTPTLHSINTTQGNYTIPEDNILPGGRITHFLKNWKKITSHPWPLQIVEEGYKIQFITNPIPWRTVQHPVNQVEQQETNLAVEIFLTAGIIEECKNPTFSNQFLSKFFTIQEPTKRRPILDCKKLNQFIQVQHFKMEGVPALRELIEKGDFIVKLDLKDAYTVVPIHPASRPYLAFQNQGTTYTYRALNFGLNTAPRIFSKLLRYALEPIRREGIRLVYFLDDICVLDQDKEQLQASANKIMRHLESLGFLVNKTKSVLTPRHVQDYLGFTFDTKRMTIKVPEKKLQNLRQRLKQTQQMTPRTCRWMAGLMGKMTAMIPAMQEALLHIRYLQRDLTRTLRGHYQN